MLQVPDVVAASEWYQQTLGFVSGHGGDEFEMLYAGEPYASPLLLQLHRWDAHEHGFLGSPDIPVGNGVSLWFQVDDRSELERRLGASRGCPRPRARRAGVEPARPPPRVLDAATATATWSPCTRPSPTSPDEA